MSYLTNRSYFLAILLLCMLPMGASYAQGVPTGEQLNELLAPIALYPDTLLAQICAAAADPQQTVDANEWVKQNTNLQGQMLTEAAQQQGFDPVFISLVSFPAVLDTMAINIDDYAALGSAFKADQATVMSAIQTLRQQAYASGALDSNQYQKVAVEQQNGAQVVVVQPVNPQVVYVPQYQPQLVYASGPSQSDVAAASLLSFGAGIAIGTLINSNQPWGWGGWRWGWGGGGMYYHRHVWRYSNRYVSPRPYYRPRPPIYNRPIYARPPLNWTHRPGYRPPPPGFRPPVHRPRPNGTKPPGGAEGYKPRPNVGKPPGNAGGAKPSPGGGGGWPGNGGSTRPPGNGGGYKPRPGDSEAERPPGYGGSTRPPGNGGATRPTLSPKLRPAPNPYAGFPTNGKQPQTQRPSVQEQTGARPGGLRSDSSGKEERAASERGRASSGAGKQSRRKQR